MTPPPRCTSSVIATQMDLFPTTLAPTGIDCITLHHDASSIGLEVIKAKKGSGDSPKICNSVSSLKLPMATRVLEIRTISSVRTVRSIVQCSTCTVRAVPFVTHRIDVLIAFD